MNKIHKKEQIVGAKDLIYTLNTFEGSFALVWFCKTFIHLQGT